MKPILMVAYQFPPHGGSSGVLRTLKFSKFLPTCGYAPHVLTLKEAFYETRDETLRGEIAKDVTVHRTFALDSSRHLAFRGRHPGVLAIPDPYIFWLPFATWRGLRVIRRHAIRLLYSTSPPPTTHLIAASLHGLTGLPWIADFRDPWIEEGIHPRPGSFRDRLERPLERRVLQAADRIVVTTPRLGAEICRRHPALLPEKVRVIYNGYDEGDFEPTLCKGAAEDFEILHAGLVTPEFRDPFPLLRTVEGLIRDRVLSRERTRVTLLGGGPYLSSDAFRRQLAELDLGNVVRIVERVSHRESLRRLGRAAVLLLLQASEDTRSLIPAKAFEYLRLGRPILALTLEGDTADVLRGMEHCHVVDPSDDAAMRRSLIELYHLWQDHEGNVFVHRPIERFERGQQARQLAAICDEVS